MDVDVDVHWIDRGRPHVQSVTRATRERHVEARPNIAEVGVEQVPVHGQGEGGAAMPEDHLDGLRDTPEAISAAAAECRKAWTPTCGTRAVVGSWPRAEELEASAPFGAARVASVPVGYLVAVALVAWCTLSALAPMRRPRVLGAMSFFFGLVLNESPFVAFYWLLASTVLAIGQGSVDSPGGFVAIGLSVLTSCGLALIVRRSLRARAAVDRALHQGLSPGWRTTLDAVLAAELRRGLPWARILFGPVFFHRRDVERVANIRYGDAGASNLLDVYRRRSLPTSVGPALVHLHGGALVRGRKNREARPLLYRLASQGWVCVSANYRLSPAVRFPDHLIDVKKMIVWIREHGHEYGVDPTMVFVAGSSSGGQLAALAALTPNDPAFQPGFERADTSVTAAICLYGYYGRLGPDDPMPLALNGTDAPPFFVAHGDRDTLVPVEDARLFVERLRTASPEPVVYAELPGAQHSFDLFHSIRFETVVDGIEAFAAWIRSRQAH
jgi:acetyl esterase/lipase